jgi:hypothetical protein
MRKRFVWIGAVLVVLALLARAWFGREPEPSVVVPADSAGAALRTIHLWFASSDGDSLTGESRDLTEQPDLHARVAVLVAALEQGPRQGGVRVLPEGTQVLHVYLEEDGLLTLDLSLPFRQGFRGGPRAEELTLGALVRTLAANVPEMQRVRLTCGGAPLPTLGGHFPLDQSLDPDEWP